MHAVPENDATPPVAPRPRVRLRMEPDRWSRFADPIDATDDDSDGRGEDVA